MGLNVSEILLLSSVSGGSSSLPASSVNVASPDKLPGSSRKAKSERSSTPPPSSLFVLLLVVSPESPLPPPLPPPPFFPAAALEAKQTPESYFSSANVISGESRREESGEGVRKPVMPVSGEVNLRPALKCGKEEEEAEEEMGEILRSPKESGSPRSDIFTA